jgi:two-component system, OmpR family, sensor kinase
MKRLSLRARLTLLYSAVLCVMLAVFGAVFYRALGLFVEQSLTSELHDEAAFLRNYMRVNDGQLKLVFDPADREQAYEIHVATRYYQVFKLPAGDLVVQSEELDLLGVRPTAEQARTLAIQKDDTDVLLPKERLRFKNSLIPSGDGTTSFLVRVAIPLSPEDAARRGFLRSLLFLAPVGVAFAALVGWQLTKRGLRPMKNLAAAARNINIQKLQQRLPVRGAGDEVDDVAQAFNDTLARLENSVDQMKQFTASISHELRTPLTALRGEAEVALLKAHSVEEYQHLLASQLEEFDKLTHMVNQLVVLARAEAGEIHWTDQSVDLSALAASLTEQMEPIASAKNVRLETKITSRIIVRGDSNWLERVILNLLDNAIKFTGGGGTVRLELTSQNGQAVLRVADTGVGIPPEAIPHVFERFFRAEPSRSKHVEGVGLGLALAKWIVEQHRGQIEAESEPARGSRFTVRLPQATMDATTVSA